MKRGFTLVEVLVIVAIFGIIISAAWKVTDNRTQEKEASIVAEHVKTTKFPIKKTSSDSVVKAAWFDDVDGRTLWLQSNDGDLVAVPSGKAMELLKKLMRRGPNP